MSQVYQFSPDFLQKELPDRLRSAPSRFGISTDLHCSVRYAVGVRWLRHLTRRQKPFRTSDVARKSHSVDLSFISIKPSERPLPSVFHSSPSKNVHWTNQWLFKWEHRQSGTREPQTHFDEFERYCCPKPLDTIWLSVLATFRSSVAHLAARLILHSSLLVSHHSPAHPIKQPVK